LWIASRCDPYKDPIPKIPAATLMEFSDKYVALFERLTGLAFERSDPRQTVRDRIRDALAKELPEYF
jgi:phosphoribosylaminoimidazole-succinocarboxamide synthase